MREKNRNSIASSLKLPQFTTMNVIDGQAGLVFYSSLIFYSLTIDNILNIIVLLILAGVSISLVIGDNGVLTEAQNAIEETRKATAKEEVELAWASLESEYWTKWAQNSATTRASVFTQANMEKYLTGKGTVGSFTYTEGGTSTITYTSNAEPNESDSYVISSTGEVSEAPVSQAEWEIVTDSGTTGLSIGDLVRPNVESTSPIKDEKFYIIGIDGSRNNQVARLLAKDCVKYAEEYGSLVVKQDSGAGVNNFGLTSCAYWFDNSTNIYRNSNIKGKMDAYADFLIDEGLSLEDVELEENGETVEGNKIRLIFGKKVDGVITGEISEIMQIGNGIINEKYYWLGSPYGEAGSGVWVIKGSNVTYDSRANSNDYTARPVIKVKLSRF